MILTNEQSFNHMSMIYTERKNLPFSSFKVTQLFPVVGFLFLYFNLFKKLIRQLISKKKYNIKCQKRVSGNILPQKNYNACLNVTYLSIINIGLIEKGLK